MEESRIEALSMAVWIRSMESHKAVSLGILFQAESSSHLQCSSCNVPLFNIQVTGQRISQPANLFSDLSNPFLHPYVYSCGLFI